MLGIRKTFIIALMLGIILPTFSFAQIGGISGIEGYKNRKVGEEPPVIEAIIDQKLSALEKLWVRDHLAFNARGKLNRTPLHVAAMVGNDTITEFLLGKKLGLNMVDDAGNTALHYAAQIADADTLALLISAGAKIDKRNHNGEVPLFYAARSGKWSVVKILLDAGANMRITDYTARNVMDYAQESKNRKLPLYLKKYGF